MADGYFLLLEDDTQVQVPFSEWEPYEMEDVFENTDLTKE